MSAFVTRRGTSDQVNAARKALFGNVTRPEPCDLRNVKSHLPLWTRSSEFQYDPSSHKHIVLGGREIRSACVELANLAAQSNEFNRSSYVNSTAKLECSGCVGPICA